MTYQWLHMEELLKFKMKKILEITDNFIFKNGGAKYVCRTDITVIRLIKNISKTIRCMLVTVVRS